MIDIGTQTDLCFNLIDFYEWYMFFYKSKQLIWLIFMNGTCFVCMYVGLVVILVNY